MATDLQMQMRPQFFNARDEYIAAIKAYSTALIAALEIEAPEVNADYERASAELERKQQAYRQATDDLRAINPLRARYPRT
jgi:hypothetical protein